MSETAKMMMGLAVLLLLCGATYFLVKNNEERGGSFEEPTAKTYTNATHGFSFSYDNSYSLVELSDRYVNIEKDVEEPNEVVSVAVETAGLEEEYEDFVAYAHHRSLMFCAADGPGGSLRCTKVTRTEPFRTVTGLNGQVYYLEMEHTTREGTSVREVGPFYAFNVSTDAPGSGYSALIFRPARFYDESEMYDEGAKATNDIVNTLQITAL